jgi:hypothetical protein
MGLSCNILIINEKNSTSFKKHPCHYSVRYVYTKLIVTNRRTNGASF